MLCQNIIHHVNNKIKIVGFKNLLFNIIYLNNKCYIFFISFDYYINHLQ